MEKATEHQRTAGLFPGKGGAVQQQASFSFGKEPFKKQLLHLFAAEQQQKEEQRQQQQQIESPVRTDLGRRCSVEIIVDDGDQKPVASRLHQSTSSSETERQDGCGQGDVATPDTQVADELSISSSDNESANGDLSLDDLLRRFISDPDALKIVREKIAENQRYLEQKLDAVSAENRFLHAECLQLRTQQMHQQQQEKKDQLNVAASILGKGVAGNLVGFLPRSFAL